MNTAVDPSAFLLVWHGVKAGVRTRHAARAFPGVLKTNVITAKEEPEDRSLRRADRAIETRV